MQYADWHTVLLHLRIYVELLLKVVLLHLYPVVNMRTAFKVHDTMLRYCIISVTDEDPGGRNIVLQFTLLL